MYTAFLLYIFPYTVKAHFDFQFEFWVCVFYSVLSILIRILIFQVRAWGILFPELENFRLDSITDASKKAGRPSLNAESGYHPREGNWQKF